MGQDGTKSSCSMVGLLGILIQVGLGVLSFSVLVLKRFREKPRRAWKIWIFDTSKQGFSQILAHFINLTISLMLAHNDSSSDECLWYFMTNILDNTIGVLITILILKFVEKQLKKRRRFNYISGNYYEKITSQKYKQDSVDLKQQPEVNKGHLHEEKEMKVIQLVKEDSHVSSLHSAGHADAVVVQEVESKPMQYLINYKAWLVQLLIWNSIVVLVKSILFGIEFALKSPLQSFSFLALGWIQAYPTLELMVVIVIVPVFMNGLAFWVQDNFIKKKEESTETSNLLEQNHKDKDDKMAE